MDANTVVLSIGFVVAGLNAFTAFMTWRSFKLTRQVEIATNSMKDALIVAARREGLQEGRDENKS